MTQRIDAHQHFWEFREPFDHSWMDAPKLAHLRRNFLPADLAPWLQKTGVDRTVFVQTQHLYAENEWVLQLADQHDWIAGVVGWVDLASSACESQLLELLNHPKFVGVRHLTHDEPDDNFIVRDDVLRGLSTLEKHNVPFDLLFFVRHLPHAATLAERLPGLRMVIDHLAKPFIKQQRLDNWQHEFQRAASYPNVYCKLSGMITEADWEQWQPSDLQPYISFALECFGPARCMFGSDWPVCELAGSYQQVHDALQESLKPLTGDEQADVLGGTAQRFYGLTL